MVHCFCEAGREYSGKTLMLKEEDSYICLKNVEKLLLSVIVWI